MAKKLQLQDKQAKRRDSYHTVSYIVYQLPRYLESQELPKLSS